VLEAATAHDLLDATRLYQRLTQLLRLCLEGTYDPLSAPAGLNRAVCLAAGTPDVKSAEDLLRQTQNRVVTLFDQLVGNPQNIS
jgi:[glutamine synthetase] adenylyltransferase / [glutamine synthetase]-adenylyl-L-tyrosine phosphorylase